MKIAIIAVIIGLALMDVFILIGVSETKRRYNSKICPQTGFTVTNDKSIENDSNDAENAKFRDTEHTDCMWR